jgi:hypothetical protein
VHVLLDALILAGLATLLSVSVAQQIFSGRWIKKLKDHDVLALIPIWSFFAPNPGRTDYHLLFRDQLNTGEWCPWREVPQAARSRFKGLWNPGKRRAKGLTDHITSLLRSLNGGEHDPIVIVLHPSYLTLLRWVTMQGSDPRSRSRQFLIAQTSGFGAEASDPDIVFVSFAHDLPGGDSDIEGRPRADSIGQWGYV